MEIFDGANAARSVFLYRKKLLESDVRQDHNRLFIRKSEELMYFLNEEELISLSFINKGVDFIVVDNHTPSKFYKLRLKKWATVKMLILTKDWNKLVLDNRVQKGDWVELSGYRQNGQPHLVVKFSKSESTAAQDILGSSSTSQVPVFHQ
ncbi:hypothetical protein DH2020_042045 [Rehmannia glutinosa]|uniref:B3 domain-containing protein n=1 Tax=Rehmannia glutinosa TaxID=99300 RepID=A0ABR0UNG2_REHGL